VDLAAGPLTAAAAKGLRERIDADLRAHTA